MNAVESIDPHLQAVVERAEGGADLYRIAVVCGPTVYIGKPVSTSAFIDKNLKELGVEFFKDAGGWKTARQDKEMIADQKARDVIAGMSPAHILPAPGVLSLSPALVFPGGMTSYEVPAIRIHLNQIDSWWVAPFTENQAKFRTSGVGVSF